MELKAFKVLYMQNVSDAAGLFGDAMQNKLILVFCKQ